MVPAYISLVEVVHVATPIAAGEGHFAPARTLHGHVAKGEKNREQSVLTIREPGQCLPSSRNVPIRDPSTSFPQLIFTNLDLNVARISLAVGKRAGGPPVGVRISRLGRDEATW